MVGYRTSRIAIFVAALAMALPLAARAQGLPTASRGVLLSGFGMASGTWTGVASGRNTGITAGVNAEFPRFFGLHPGIEIRGTVPFDSGNVVGQKDLLGGIKLGAPLFGLNVYGDVLYGRGEMIYQKGGFPVGNLLFLKSSSGVLSFGGGAELGMTDHFALKGDYQFQKWNTPVLTSGTAHPQVVSLGLVYRFNVSRYPSGPKRRRERDLPPPPVAVAAPAPPPVSDAVPPVAAPAASDTAPPQKPSPDVPLR